MLRLDDGITGMYEAKAIDVGEKIIPISVQPKGDIPTVKKTDIPTDKQPFGNIFQGSPMLGGLNPEQVIDFWTLLLGSAEDQTKTALGYTGAAVEVTDLLGITEKLFGEGSATDIYNIDIPEFAGSKTPVLPLVDRVISGSGDFIGNLQEALQPKNGDGVPWWLWVIIGIGGIYLLGKYLGGRKK